jgi:hypothetical protein
MAQAVNNTHQEFWRPPSVSIEIAAAKAVPTMAEVCQRCGTEFLLGSRFCHACGGRRREVVRAQSRADAAALAGVWQDGVSRVHAAVDAIPWGRVKAKMGSALTRPSWLHSIPYSGIKRRIGLSTAPLAALTVGVACIAGALLVGLLPAKTAIDFQAIQFYRIECLLGATAAFVAGILLKTPLDRDHL